MKRTLVVLLVMALATLSAGAAYKIQLKDGKVINVDDKPLVSNEMAYFTKAGVYFYLPVSSVDFEKTEKLNAPAVAAPVAEKVAEPAPKAPVKVEVIGDEQLDQIRKRSRLANEGELSGPPAEAAAGGAPAGAPQVGGRTGNADLQARLADLLNQRAEAQQRVNDLQSQIQTLRDKYNFSPQYSDQQAIQSQIDSTQAQLDSAKAQLDSINNQALAAQQELAHTPVVVQAPAPEQAPPPPPQPEAIK